MKYDRDFMLERFLARDEEMDGRFVAGVLSTGIYCLPSCPARKPNPENIRFFATEAAARAEGLRPCKRCRPDHFYRGHDPDLALAKALAAGIRRDPAAAGDVNDLVTHAEVGATKLHALFREHFHTTPAQYLQRARIAAACRLLEDAGANVAETAFAAGYESLSVFYEHFRAWTGLRPTDYRDLGAAGKKSASFTLALPGKYHVPYTLARWGRNAESRSVHVKGSKITAAVRLAETPALLICSFTDDSVRCRVASDARLEPEHVRAAHRLAVRLTGLHSSPDAFVARLRDEARLFRLIAPRPGLHIPQTATFFEGLMWSIVGQQVNVEFAFTLERRLTELCGTPVDGLIAPPTPAAVAALDYADLQKRQFSRRKAEYLIDIARELSADTILKGVDEAPATDTHKELLSLRGIGPWSANYVMMRSLGFADCVPLGDTGLTSALQAFFELEERPDKKRTTELMAPFAPHRSLATHHLWMYESS